MLIGTGGSDRKKSQKALFKLEEKLKNKFQGFSKVSEAAHRNQNSDTGCFNRSKSSDRKTPAANSKGHESNKRRPSGGRSASAIAAT